MREELELEVAPFLDGPAAGEKGEIPVDYEEIWRFVAGVGYCLYRRDSERSLCFTGEILNEQEMADWLAAQTIEPLLHSDEEVPRARRVRFQRRPR